MTATETTTWRTLAAGANDKWYTGSLKGKRYTEFVKALPKVEKEAVVLEDLYCQVENGGFWQWVVNGYCVSIAEVIQVLKQIRQPASNKLLLTLVQIEPYLQKNKEKGSCFEDYVVPEVTNEEHPFWDKLDQFSDQFHAFSDAWKQEVETYLAAML